MDDCSGSRSTAAGRPDFEAASTGADTRPVQGFQPESGEFLSGKVQEDVFPLKFAHGKQFLAIFRDKGLEGKFFVGEPLYGKSRALLCGENVEVSLFFLSEREEQINGELSLVGLGLVWVFFPFPDFKLFLKQSG